LIDELRRKRVGESEIAAIRFGQRRSADEVGQIARLLRASDRGNQLRGQRGMIGARAPGAGSLAHQP
jgi:hypothetical protein